MLYGLEDLGVRRKKHHIAFMYRHSKTLSNLDVKRPEVILPNNNKLNIVTIFLGTKYIYSIILRSDIVANWI